MEKIFLKAPARVAVYRETIDTGSLPPAPVITRWTTWLSAALFYCEHWTKFCQVIERLDEDEAQSIRKVKNVIQKTTVNQDLAFIKSHLKFIISCIENLEKKGIDLNESLSTLESVEENVRAIPGSVGKNLKNKFKELMDLFIFDDHDS